MSENNSENLNKPKKINQYWKGGFLTLGHARDIILVALLIIITWKLLNSKIEISLESFSFNDFLSVTLALFAISLSAAFYFKATDTSNKFYDNSYKLTKDISEILGRIETGFGEKLKHIDDGNTQLKDKFDRMPFNVEEARKKEKEEEKHIKEQEDERDKIISSLMEKAEVAGNEKEELLAKLQAYSNELDLSKNKLRKVQSKIDKAEFSAKKSITINNDHMATIIGDKLMNEYGLLTKSEIDIDFHHRLLSGYFRAEDIFYLREHGLVKDTHLTNTGISLLLFLSRTYDQEI